MNYPGHVYLSEGVGNPRLKKFSIDKGCALRGLEKLTISINPV